MKVRVITKGDQRNYGVKDSKRHYEYEERRRALSARPPIIIGLGEDGLGTAGNASAECMHNPQSPHRVRSSWFHTKWCAGVVFSKRQVRQPEKSPPVRRGLERYEGAVVRGTRPPWDRRQDAMALSPFLLLVTTLTLTRSMTVWSSSTPLQKGCAA